MPEDPIERLNVDLEVYGIPQTPGMPPMTETFLHVRRRQDGAAGTAVLGLPAYQGEQGPAGPAAAIHQGDRTPAQLTTLAGTLGVGQTNYAYRNTTTNDMYVWDGDSFVVYADAYGAEGPAGPPPTLIDGVVKYDGEVISGASVDITGSNPYQISIDLPDPTGPDGPEGPPGPMLDSTDITGTPTDGQILAYDAETETLVWTALPGAIEEYVVPPSGFPASLTLASGTARQQLVSANIPAKTYPYRLDFTGGVDVNTTVGHIVDVEIRTSNAVSGPLVGYGKGQDGAGWREVAFRAHSDVAIQPGSSEAVIAPGTPVTVYASAVKVAGSTDSWSVRNTLAQLRIRLTRVA